MPKTTKRKKIKRELPPVGTKMEATFHGKKYKARIVKDKKFPGERAILFKGKKYYSMSGAAKAFTNFAVNGWRYWKY